MNSLRDSQKITTPIEEINRFCEPEKITNPISSPTKLETAPTLTKSSPKNINSFLKILIGGELYISKMF